MCGMVIIILFLLDKNVKKTPPKQNKKPNIEDFLLISMGQIHSLYLMGVFSKDMYKGKWFCSLL